MLRLPKLLPAAALFAGLLALTVAHHRAAAADADKYHDTLKNSTDPKARAAALEKLAKMGQVLKATIADAVPDMMKALDDKDPVVRAAAAKAVAQIDPNPEVAVPALLKLTKDDQPEAVRLAAIQGLGYLGAAAKDARPALQKIVKDEEDKSKLNRAATMSLRSINAK